MNVSVLVPWQPGCPHREAAWEFLRPRWDAVGELVVGTCDGTWVKADAVADALERASGDVLVIADADVWVDPTAALEACQTWAVPHLMVNRLSPRSTVQMIDGADWRYLPLDQNDERDRTPYPGQVGGGVTVIRRDLYHECPIPRVLGWGQEDESWAIALEALYGPPWRGDADLVHLWHPPQRRITRVVGSVEGRRLKQRFDDARHDPDRIRALIEEAR